MTKVYLGLGTNLGDMESNLRNALLEIQKRVGSVTSQSAFYLTEPWGFDSENKFLNMVVEVETTLAPFKLLSVTQSIEKELGRLTKSKDGIYSDRLIDIDILFYGQEIITDAVLTIPHPLLHKRDFVLKPLKEIATSFVHPLLGCTIAEITGN
ncbi:MAG: 2-amino-4-hydroxy-6-hydroxymethyldihydropteridine diphosphokinase [Bacteroidales bacterium]